MGRSSGWRLLSAASFGAMDLAQARFHVHRRRRGRLRGGQGEAFGFLGPNGAGKSSTMRMIGCVSPISGGKLRVLGLDPAADGPRSGPASASCPQEDNLDLELTV